EEAQQAWSVYQQTELEQAQRYLVRTGEFSGFAGTADWFEQVKQIQMLQNPDLAIENVSTIADACQTALTSNRKPCQNLSLRTGMFQTSSQESGVWLLWKWPIILLGLLLVVYLFSVSLQTQQHTQQAQAYQTQTEALFKQRFPDVKRIVNIKTQAKTAFAKEGNQLEAGVGPSQLAKKVEAVFKKYPTVKIQRLDWKDSSAQLLITLQTPQVSALQNLAKEVKAIQSSELKVKNVSQTLAEGVLYVDAN
ncbi:MAG: type II secretion system protein GspL, partial [Pseudomonadota bacterium]|nr:type II secretion system protein GspL [Pseudomonadota bacterium]